MDVGLKRRSPVLGTGRKAFPMTKIGHVARKRRLERLRRLKGDLGKPNPPTKPLAISVAEFADLTGISIATLWRAVRLGQLKHAKFRDRVIIPYSEVERIVGIEPEPAGAEP